ncbi:unnamed protein product [Cuscuta campestris]|uniref:D-isomer specific 2-hydroxyacid dehydrogenase NAD-binding domain-containing protein n=1 Tax=Cuscuta campestris TaxID=132261 RepID=A0A484LKS7_9ASTE|nr:unnamed protein product [Cuscuta campestris]
MYRRRREAAHTKKVAAWWEAAALQRKGRGDDDGEGAAATGGENDVRKGATTTEEKRDITGKGMPEETTRRKATAQERGTIGRRTTTKTGGGKLEYDDDEHRRRTTNGGGELERGRKANSFRSIIKVGGKRVGIVGLGSIGLRVSKRLEALGCTIAYTSKKVKPHIPFSFHPNITDLATACDALVLCCALTQETNHIVDKKVMLALGKGGIIINIGRGALIDEKEMVDLLARGELGGAGLDVFENEPNVPRELVGLDNVVLSSHVSYATHDAMFALQELVANNIDSFFSNNKALQAEIGGIE